MRAAAFSFAVSLLFAATLISDHNPAQTALFQMAAGFAVFCAALALMEWHVTRRMFARLTVPLQMIAGIPPRRYVGLCALLFFLLAATLSQVLFDGLPHVGDTHAQYVHSKIMASGHLYLPSHPLRQFFDFQNMVNDGRFYSVYAPGHLIMLTLGQLAGAPWLVNPILGALTVIAAYLLARETSGRRIAYLTLALMLACPFIVFMSSEYMNNATCLLFLTLFLYAYIRQDKSGDWHFAAMAGLCVGYAFITRPQTTLPFALPLAFHALYRFGKNPHPRWRPTLALILTFAALASCLLIYNVAMNGNPFIMSRTDPLKFVTPFSSLSAIRTHIAADALRLNRTLSWLHAYLFGWPTSSLLLVLLLVLFRGLRHYERLIFSCALTQAASLLINPFYSLIFGPRYLYETSVILIILTAACFMRLPLLIRKRLHARLRLAPARGAMAAIGLAFFAMAIPHHILPRYHDYKNNYWEGNVPFYRMVMSSIEAPAIIFCEQYEEFRWLYFLQPPADDSSLIVALDKGEDENKKLMDFYPGRHVYQVGAGLVARIK